MTISKKAEPPPAPPPDVRDLTDSIRAASLESTEQIEESRRLSKDSGKRIAAALPTVDADPAQDVRSDTASLPSTPRQSEE